MSEVTLLSALECIQSSLAKTRIKGFQDLRYILRHNQNSSKVTGLDDASFHSIFETLFQAAIGEQSQVAKAKTSATQRSASSRLSELASALRHAVEIGAPLIKAKTARAVLDHVVDTIQLPNGSFCEPIAVDYAKCMREILRHQPHVEHLNRPSTTDRNHNDWDRIADFCARCVQEVTSQISGDEFSSRNEPYSTAATVNALSYRSSRSVHRDSGGSQINESAVRMVADEMIGCLRALTAAPNAPLQNNAESLLWLLINYLSSTISTPRSPDDAFTAINQLLCWTRTEDTKLTQSITARLVRLIKSHWTAKSPALSQLTITILLLQPYIFHAMSQDEELTLQTELSALLQAMQGEYSQRQEREQPKQLSMEDIRLEINVTRALADGTVGVPLFTLQPSETRSHSESSWTLVYLLSSLTSALMGAGKLDSTSNSDQDDLENGGQRPSKRRRRDFHDQNQALINLLKASTSGSLQGRICALQILAFLVQQRALGSVDMTRTIDALMLSCADDMNPLSSWAYLALACCASQASATSAKLTSRWTSLWQLASRGLSNINLCRSASFAMCIMLQIRLVPHSSINDFVQIATNAMDLNGPAQITDAVTQLLTSVLQYSRQTNPEASSATAESILAWLLRTFTPSKIDDKPYAAGTAAYEASDLISLFNAILNRRCHSLRSSALPTWHGVARAWLFCEGQKELISYLLLNDENAPCINPSLRGSMHHVAAASTEVTRASCEALALTHLVAELTRTNEAWTSLVTERTRHPSHDSFAMLCKASCIVVCISSCVEFHDSRRSLQLRTLSENLLRSLGEYAARPDSDQTKVDRFLTTFSSVFSGLGRHGTPFEYRRLPCEVLVCQTIKQTLETRQEAAQYGDTNDAMVVDDDLEDSQDSRHAPHALDTTPLANDLDVAYGKLALRSSAALYAVAIVALENGDQATTEPMTASEQVVGFLLEQSDTAVIASRSVITQLNHLGLVLALPEVQRLLEFFVDTIIPSYAYGRSEVAIGTMLDVMYCLTEVWTDSSNTNLYNLGLDVYDWCTDTALPNGVLSPIVQKRLATLLVQLCRLPVEYPASDSHESYAQDSSARTSLFNLLKQGAVTVQFDLAENITKVFGRTVLSKHEPMFQDLVESLPEDIDKAEGIAMRLLFFARLGSEWHSLLRQCVYYIFETAGTGSVSHAARCIQMLANRLPLQTPRKLFSLFAPQLLFTWLSSDKSLREIPFAAFQYNSLNELLVENQTEVCAQAVMMGSEEGINVLSKALKILPKGVITNSYAKSVAYAIGCDIKTAGAKGFSGDSAAVEHRLRSLMGSKKEHEENMKRFGPAIIGYFFLTTQHEDVGDKWLEDRPQDEQNYEPDNAVMLAALQKVKAFSHSTRMLPQSQEPSFRSSDLGKAVGRLCRRTKCELSTLWDSSSFTLVVRMLLDAMDESLGSLHSCLMIRRLRILICMAGEVAFQGFPLEMLIHSLRPFLNDSECADDTLGILHYLFNNSQDYLRKHMPFLCGTVTLLVLQLRKHAKSSHNSTTQESQHSTTVQKMLGFQKYLVGYLSKRASDCSSVEYDGLTRSLSSLQLPGNARRDSPESSLLLFLTTQWSAAKALCTRTDCLEAIKMLGEAFEPATSIADDCLGRDVDAALHSQALWDVMLQASLSLEFTHWAARVIGRAYASTGQRPDAASVEHTASDRAPDAVHDDQVTAESQAFIAKRWAGLLFSRSRIEAGLAEHSLRKLVERLNWSTPETRAFAEALPAEVDDAVSTGCFSYEPPSADQRTFTAVQDVTLRSALQISAAKSLEDWTRDLAVTVCRWSSHVPVVACLAPLMYNVAAISADLLPSMLHILLVEEMNRERTLRIELSAAVTTSLADADPTLQDKQRFLLKLMLYLRSQTYPGESTPVDRLQWLEVDYALAASAAARCGMPHCGLLLAESIPPVMQSRRTSGRASLSLSQIQSGPAFENGLLLSIYQQVEEPDSFYGVQQPASLDTVLTRLDHEADGLRSLMFRSAQVDSHMRRSHRLAEDDAVGMVQNLSKLNFNSLAFVLLQHGLGSNATTSESMLDAAKALQQWDIDLPEARDGDAFTSFAILQDLNRAAEPEKVNAALRLAVADHAHRGISADRSLRPSLSWCGTLASLTEMEAILSSSDLEDMAFRWQAMQDGSSWMHMARYEDVRALLSNRETLFGVISQNLELQKGLHMGQRDARTFEVQALLDKSKLAREHSRLQEALTATATLSGLVELCKSNNLKVEGVVKMETASVLWNAGEASTSVKMLRDVLEMADLGKQDIPVGRAGLRAQLAHQLAEARLEKPEDILRQYLKPAINDLKTVKTGAEAGKVFYEFAKFCDDELQNPGNMENFNRVVKLRHSKQEEVDAIRAAIQARETNKDLRDLQRTLGQEEKWLEMDTIEEKRLRDSRSNYVQQSLQNYLLALQASDEHDICVLRFFALWLEHSDDDRANSVVQKYLKDVPSWKFVLLMNQLMSRVSNEPSIFQAALSELMIRVFKQHPYHSLHHLFANAFNEPKGDDPTTRSRFQGALNFYRRLRQNPDRKIFMDRVFAYDRCYNQLADSSPEPNKANKFKLEEVSAARKLNRLLPEMQQPPVTINLVLRPSGKYDDVPHIDRLEPRGTILGGVSAPKLITLFDSNNKQYKQIFKNGRDDLRQDAIMEQVFEEVSKMLRNHKPTRQRDLKVRTYKVIPLSNTTGVIEFVPNSLPLMDFLRPAHIRYHPKDIKESKAREMINGVKDSPQAQRISQFRKVCEQMQPVLRHFFLERYDNPDEWFKKRTAYTRTTASVSILGHIIGLGDRHCSNILIDQMTGEIVHIDLGVSFEAGKVLPIPELVPFRLTRDIIDGMGITKTEGVFRRCCEFTLDAVREDKDSIMTLLNVLRYDPLYNWTVSPLKAKRMQQAQDTGRQAADDIEPSTRKRNQDGGESERSLQIVEKKLSKTLSTAATVNELIQQATDESHLACLFSGWGAYY